MTGPTVADARGTDGVRLSGWAWLVLAGVFEIGMTTALKLEQSDSRFLAVFIVCAIISFELLAQAIKSIPLGLAYAIWTGIGAVGTAAVGIAAFGDPLGPVRAILLAVLVAAMVGLKLVAGKPTAVPSGQPSSPG